MWLAVTDLCGQTDSLVSYLVDIISEFLIKITYNFLFDMQYFVEPYNRILTRTPLKQYRVAALNEFFQNSQNRYSNVVFYWILSHQFPKTRKFHFRRLKIQFRSKFIFRKGQSGLNSISPKIFTSFLFNPQMPEGQIDVWNPQLSFISRKIQI